MEQGNERITRDECAHVARLARLALSDDEIDTFTGQLGAILDHVASIEALDLDGVTPMSHPVPLVNVFRDDVVTPSLDRDEVLAVAPAAEDGQFRVPPVLGEEP